MSDTEQVTEQQPETEQQERTFTQADIDDLMAKVRHEERRKATERFADYDDLKAKAGQTKTAEDRIAALEGEVEKSRQEALRAKFAADVPEKLRPLLTGTTEDELRAQRDLLVDSESERRKRSNHVPNEGNNPRPPSDDRRDFVRRLTGRD